MAASDNSPPNPSHYQAFYCEENLWWWTRALSPEERAHAYVLVISNEQRRAAIALQRLGQVPLGLMIWDYHVVGLLKTAPIPTLTDFDANTPTHTFDAQWWIQMQGHILSRVEPGFEPLFRPIPAGVYFETFSSTRRHMLDEAGEFIHPEPSWPCIRSTSQYLAELEGLLDPEAPEGWLGLGELEAYFKLG